MRQAAYCLRDVAYPMRRIETEALSPCLDRDEFGDGYRRLDSVGYPVECSADVAWSTFSELRSAYAPIACQILFWTIATPAPWSGERLGFPEIVGRPDAPNSWSTI